MKGAFDQLVNSFKGAIQFFPDKRIGDNRTYSMEDAALGAFSVFFTQCPFFLAYQRGMQEAEGKSNAQTLFGIEEIPTDNHIRTLLDPVSPEIVYPVFDEAFNLLNKEGHIDKFRAIKENLIIILVCKEESYKYLYERVALIEEGVDRHTVSFKRWNGKIWQVYTYRYANDVPLRDTDDALRVNWIELKISTEEGKIIYQNAFITNHTINEKNAKDIALCGRTRWKIGNENNNTLKTKGYYLEHNYGHGKKNLSFLLATFIILAFLFHTLLEIMDKKYQLIRKTLPTKKTFLMIYAPSHAIYVLMTGSIL